MKSYYKKLKKFQGSVIIYVLLFFVCVLTQFGVNFINAPSFQLFLGIALFPLVKPKYLVDRFKKRTTKYNS